MGYLAGWNLPGCLPDSSDELMGRFDTLDEARRYLIDEAKRREDEAAAVDDEDTATQWCFLAEDLNLLGVGYVQQAPDGYVWWIEPS